MTCIPKGMYDENAPRPYWNNYTRKYEHAQQREDIIRVCREFNCVHFDCYEITFESFKHAFHFAGNWYKYKVTLYFGNGYHNEEWQVFYINHVI